MSQLQETPLSAFYAWERDSPGLIFLRQPVLGEWKTWTYQQAGDEIRRIAAALRALDLPAQSNIAILSKNCAHWIMADLAIMMAGHVSVPIYPTSSGASIGDLMRHSEVRAVFLGKLDEHDAARGAVDQGMPRICFPFYGPDDGEKWEDLLRVHQPITEKFAPDPQQTASIVYSSGTTGAPKGVMLSFGAFGYVGSQVKQYLRISRPEKFFSYLPLSHIAERALMEMVAISSGSSISFTESAQTFQEDLKHELPTIFGGVPRIYSRFQEGVLTRIRQRRFDRLLSIPGINILFRRSIIRKLGLSKARIIVCGAAPVPVSLLDWYNRLGLEVREMYGMTENTAYSHANFRLIRNGTVGQPWPGADVKIDKDGEILVRHPALMKGYYKDDETTANVFAEEGFLRTGDLGKVDAQGFLTITGRLKDQFKTDKAKFVSPAPIELKFASSAEIDQVCVVGEGLPQPLALVTLSEYGKKKPQAEVESALQQIVNNVNATLESYERINTTVVVPETWTIENGLLTPSLKIRRHEVEKRYQDRFGEWREANGPVVWADTAVDSVPIENLH